MSQGTDTTIPNHDYTRYQVIPNVLEVLYCFLVLDYESKLEVRSESISIELNFEGLTPSTR